MLTIGSVFSGIGGLELGLERAGLGPVLWQVEVDAYCRAVLSKHWPHVTRYEDVRAVRATTLAAVDLLCGGFPCQDVSGAGKGAGLDGERSGLWFEFRRLVAELRPEWVVVENVASGKARYLPTVRGNLCELGYRTRAFGLSASDVGAPHLRKRVFVVADRERDRLQGRESAGTASRAARRGGALPDPHGEPVRVVAERVPGDGREAFSGAGAPSLQTIARAWPTATDASASRRAGYMLTGHSGTTLHDAIDSHLGAEMPKAGVSTSPPAVLNPRFVEALMGFPPGWTTLSSPQISLRLRSASPPSATPSSRSAPR